MFSEVTLAWAGAYDGTAPETQTASPAPRLMSSSMARSLDLVHHVPELAAMLLMTKGLPSAPACCSTKASALI